MLYSDISSMGHKVKVSRNKGGGGRDEAQLDGND